MQLKIAKDILDFFKADGRNFVNTFFAVITKGKFAFELVDLRSTDTLTYAIRFMVYVAVISFLLWIPTSALMGLPYDRPAYVVATLTLVLVLWLSYATVLHLGMKWLGGKAQLIQTISIFCFLTAYFIPIMIVQWPLHKFFILLTKGSANLLQDYILNLSAAELITLLALHFISTILMLYFFVLVFRVLRYVHELRMLRALIGFFLGIIGVFLIILLISFPLHRTIFNAFHG